MTEEWGAHEKRLVALTALTIVFDGADIQLVSFAVPAMMRDWGVSRSAFAPVLASGLAGMMAGGALAGVVGDRLGRRVALIGSVLVFAGLTLAMAMVDGLAALGVLRFVAGMGLGGAVPNATALVSEYAPLRHRATTVMMTIVCVPIGGTLAGVVAAQVLPALGWRALFVIGGLAPLTVAIVLMVFLPESPAFVDAARRGAGRGSIAALFTHDFRRDTLALWAAFMSCLLAVYLVFNWVPAMLTGAGLDIAVASTGLAAFNLGGVAGAIGGALLMSRLGSKATMLWMSAGAAAGALVLAAMRIASDSAPLPIIAMLAVIGALINATQISMYAVAAHVYPTAVRATGVGSASAVGRTGAILSSYAGAWALEGGGSAAFFALIAGAMLLSLAALAVLRRHIPRVAA